MEQEQLLVPYVLFRLYFVSAYMKVEPLVAYYSIEVHLDLKEHKFIRGKTIPWKGHYQALTLQR